MKTQQKTRIQTERECRESNLKHILAVCGLSLVDYDLTMVEIGCQFADCLYPKDTKHAKYRDLILYSKQYWVWWQSEWAKWERELLLFAQKSNQELTYEAWLCDHYAMVADTHIEHSYNHNYLKQVNNLI